MSRSAETRRSNVRLIDVVDALEDRRLELEQRDRLAGDELGPVDEQLHGRGRDPHPHALRVALVDEEDRLVLGEVRVGDDDLVDAVAVDHGAEVVQRTERHEPVRRPRRERDEADDADRGVRAVPQRVGDRVDVRARADEHRAPLVARRAEDHPGEPLVGRAQQRDDRDREDQRAVEDVVRRELLAVHEREGQRDERHLEQPGHDRAHARARAAVRVQPRAGEEQDGQQVREGDDVLRLVDLRARIPVLEEHRLHAQRDEDREPDPGEVERGERQHAREAPQRAHLQHERQRGRPLAADVLRGQREVDSSGLRVPRLFSLMFSGRRRHAPRTSTTHRARCRGTAHRWPPPTSAAAPARSMVRESPSRRVTSGFQASSFSASVVSGWRTCGSSVGSAS